MSYDRYDDRRPTSRAFRDQRPTGYDRDDRGFFDRARDEVASWFGDERAETRRDLDDRYDDRFERSPRQREFGSSDYERSPRFRDEGYRRPYTGRSSGQSYGSDFGPERAYSNDRWDRGLTQRTASGMASGGLHDRDYGRWRSRQIDELDRDYDEFRRENSQRFENEFTSWRQTRQTKRQLLSQVSEHMDVVGSDLQPVGKVDKVKGDGIVLTKNDSPDGRHHFVGCSMIDRLEGNQIILDQSAEEALGKIAKDDNSRALFEPMSDREDGPHMLNRSFSGTY